jgi:hypothetical protein
VLVRGIQQSGHAEVSQFQVHLRVHEDVLRLEVAVQYPVCVHEPHCQDHLQNPIGDQCLAEMLPCLATLLDVPRDVAF